MAAQDHTESDSDSNDDSGEQAESTETPAEYHAMFHAISSEPSKNYDIRRTLQRALKASAMLMVAALIVIFTVGLTVAPTKSSLYLAIMEEDNLNVRAIQELVFAAVELAEPEIGLEVGPFGFVAQMTPLFAALSRDNASDVVAALLRSGASPNREGFRVGPYGLLASMNALCIAATGPNSTELLLAYGADPRRLLSSWMPGP